MLAILIFLAILLLFREVVCWYFKINTILETLRDIQSTLANQTDGERTAGDRWLVRASGKLRPMEFIENSLSNAEMKTWIEEGKIDLRNTLLCPPGESSFRRFDSVESILAAIKSAEHTAGADNAVRAWHQVS